MAVKHAFTSDVHRVLAKACVPPTTAKFFRVNLHPADIDLATPSCMRQVFVIPLASSAPNFICQFFSERYDRNLLRSCMSMESSVKFLDERASSRIFT